MPYQPHLLAKIASNKLDDENEWIN
jgi:hypothetical protein